MDNNMLENEELNIVTLTDDDGNELTFLNIASTEYNGTEYMAFIPCDEEGNETSEEYVILKCIVDDDGEVVLETIDDDDEFDAVADIFDDQFMDIDYDE